MTQGNRFSLPIEYTSDNLQSSITNISPVRTTLGILESWVGPGTIQVTPLVAKIGVVCFLPGPSVR